MPKRTKRILLGEGYPGKAVMCSMYLVRCPNNPNWQNNLIPLVSFRDLWDKKIRLVAEIIDDAEILKPKGKK
jgi:hypothetical protein